MGKSGLEGTWTKHTKFEVWIRCCDTFWNKERRLANRTDDGIAEFIEIAAMRDQEEGPWDPKATNPATKRDFHRKNPEMTNGVQPRQLRNWKADSTCDSIWGRIVMSLLG